MGTIKLDDREWHLGPALGSGGFGRVFEVSSTAGDPAVAKLFPKDPGADRELLFSGEGVRNVVPIVDRGEHDGNWVIVMPRAEKSLRDHLAAVGGPLPEDEAVVILRDIAVALADLHGDVVHRDLKPENVLLLEGRWCVADFGLARYAEAATGTNTRKGYGTLPYMAPETWKFERATIATDVYALGVIGYELLTGELPFQGPQDYDFRRQHLHEAPPRLTSASPLLAAAVEECLYKAPQVRPTPDKMLDRLLRSVPSTGGLAALAAANHEEVVRKAEAQRVASVAETEAERRAELFSAAKAIHSRLSKTCLSALREAAPAATITPGKNGGWAFSLGDARLQLSTAQATRKSSWGSNAPGTIDVIAAATLQLQMPVDARDYQGRGHALWFCDAQTTGQYDWFETAFMPSPLRRGPHPAIVPFALLPCEDAARAIGPALDIVQVAWPFTVLDLTDLGEFIGRWAAWLSAAATGRLNLPSMPERAVDGTWRLH